LALAAHDTLIEINLHVREREHGIEALRRSPQHGTNAREQLARAERFYDVIVRTDFEQQYFVDFVGESAEHDHRGLRPRGAKALAYFASSESGHSKIDQNQIRTSRKGLLQPGGSVAHEDRLKSFIFKH